MIALYETHENSGKQRFSAQKQTMQSLIAMFVFECIKMLATIAAYCFLLNWCNRSFSRFNSSKQTTTGTLKPTMESSSHEVSE